MNTTLIIEIRSFLVNTGMSKICIFSVRAGHRGPKQIESLSPRAKNELKLFKLLLKTIILSANYLSVPLQTFASRAWTIKLFTAVIS